MSWLAKARKLKGVTGRELSEATGFSLNYIQQIESGRRAMSGPASERIYRYLGFDESEMPFDSRPLMDKLKAIESSVGSENFCLCKVSNRCGVGYIMDVMEAQEGMDLTDPPASFEPIRVCYAKNNLEAQMTLFEKPYDD